MGRYTKHKSNLIVVNDAREDLFNSVCYGFGDNFENNIAKTNRSKIIGGVGVINFRD